MNSSSSLKKDKTKEKKYFLTILTTYYMPYKEVMLYVAWNLHTILLEYRSEYMRPLLDFLRKVFIINSSRIIFQIYANDFFPFMLMAGTVDSLSVVSESLNFADIYRMLDKYVLVLDEVLATFKDKIPIHFTVPA